MSILRFGELDTATARSFAWAWRATGTDRLTWLEDRVGRGFSLSPAGLDAVWDWYLVWRLAPRRWERQPRPYWWVDEGDGSPYDDAQAIGVDAIAHLLLRLAEEARPEAAFGVALSRGAYPLSVMHQPALVPPNADPRKKKFVFGFEPLAAADGSCRIFDAGPTRSPVPLRTSFQNGLITLDHELAAQPQALAPAFTVEAPEDGDYTWTLSLQDDLARDNDLSTAFVAAVRDLPEVASVWHQDREVLHVLAPGVSKRSLTKACRAALAALR